jgi:hypothetical protein
MKRALVFAALLAGCSSTQTVSSLDQDGCTLCHTNLTNAHARAVVMCTSCHGQNSATSQSQLASLQQQFHDENPSYGSPLYQQLLDAMHVHPKDPSFFLANGESNDTGACFNGVVTPGCKGEDKTKLGDIDDAVDSEYARDVNYVRFMNPGDLRVAQASCGGGNQQQGSYSGCHSEEVKRVRRSIMTGNSSVVTAAYMGNRGQPATPTQTGEIGDPRGYMFELDSVDNCFKNNTFDRACLDARNANYPTDEPLSPLMPENVRAQFDVFPGPINALPDVGGMPGPNPTTLVGAHTLPHQGWATRLDGIGGQPLGNNMPRTTLKQPDNFDASLLVQFSLTPTVAAATLTAAVCSTPGVNIMGALVEPVDGILRGFRAYYPLWLPGTGHNFDPVAGNTLDFNATGIHTAGFGDTKAFNPFGRGHGSGCTGCHMLYDNDGHSHEADRDDGDQTIRLAHREPSLDLVDGMGAAQQGMNVQPDDPSSGHKQQRFYPSRHRITSRIPTRQCGLCHTFVTRIDLAYQGLSEVEEKSTLARGDLDGTRFPSQGDLTFSTGRTRVRILDSLERVSQNGPTAFAVTTDPRWKRYRAAVQAECQKRSLDCDGLAIYSADLNNNGELDDDEHFADSITGGELWLPDRVPREQSVDGRQVRILYGGPNGSTHLKDVHFEKGMHCADCHFYQDVHGDGNIYTDNWEQIEIECEDCHGFAKTRAQDVQPGKLLTSGPNGNNDLMKARDEFGRQFFFVGTDGHLKQRSRVNPDLVWDVPQIADTPPASQDPNKPDTNPHSDKHLPTGPGEAGKLECYSCHNSFAMNCLACHYQENFNQGVKQQKEVFLTGGVQGSHTNFQLFGMVRGPLILGINGDAENHRLAPFRSTMEAYVALANCSGDTVANFVVHSNCRNPDNRSGFGKVVTSGSSMNNFMPHSVRTDTVRGCETCHPAKNADGDVVNNHLLAQTMGLGTGRLNVLGDWLFVASSTKLDVVDIKNESELPDTSANNSFPGFIVGKDNSNGATLRSFAMSPTAGSQAQDVVLVRGFNGQICAIDGEKLLNPDIAVVAAGTAGVQVFDASLPDLHVALGLPSAPLLTVPGNAVAIDHPAPDLADPFFYVADVVKGLEIIDLSGVFFSPLDKAPAPANLTPKVPSTFPLPGPLVAAGVHVMGDVVAVTANAASATQPNPTLFLINVSNKSAPTLIGQTSLCGNMSCTSVAGRVTSQGAVVYVALKNGTTGSLAAVDVTSFSSPSFLGAASVGAPAEDVALSGHLAFVAAGSAGLVVIDVTDPAAPSALATQPSLPAGAIAHGVVIGAVPTQTWAFVAADTKGVMAVNVSTLFDPYRGRSGQPDAPIASDHVSLTLESRDPLSPRDTTVNTDEMPVLTFTTAGAARRIARGLQLDRLVDESGRRLRDQWNPGSNVLSQTLMDSMRSQSFPYLPPR